MKYISIGVLVFALIVASVGPVAAATVTAPTINVTLSVLDAFQLIVDVRRENPPTFTDVPDTQMAFGNLIVGGGTLVAAEGRVAFINVISNAGTQYTLNANGTALTRVGGTETIPNGAYVSNVNKSDVTKPGTVNRPQGTGVGSFVIFTSDATGSQTQLEDHRTIANDPALGVPAGVFVPQSQRQGDYAGTLIYSATRP